MKNSSSMQAASSRARLVSGKPGAVVATVLVLAISVMLLWRHFGGFEAAHSVSMKPVTSEDQGQGRFSGQSKKRLASTVPVEAPSADATRYDSELAVTELIRQLNATEQSKDARYRAALALAKDGTETAMRALKAALLSGLPELQEIIAEALGQCANQESGPILEGLLSNESEPVVLAAIRSLAQQATPLAVTSLSQLLYNEGRTVDVRAEAALGIGAVARPEALATLALAAAQIQDEAVVSQVIRGIAGRSFDETRSFMQTFLEAPHVTAELKVEALEGLSEAKGDATPFLLKYARSDDPDMRAAAAAALSAIETRGNAGAEVIALLKDEADPLVRKRLFDALANQQAFDLNAAWTQAANERDPAARIAGMDLLAKAVQQNPSAEMISFFDRHALPELQSAALSGVSRDQRLASVMVLRRAKTAGANAVLREIASQTSDPRVAAATGVDQRAGLRR